MSKIEFSLFAPYNDGAVLLGSFSDWKDVPMTKDNDGYYKTTCDLADGTYQYKYRVQSKSWFFKPNEWVSITDPYATDIDTATQNGVLRIKNGIRIVDDYEWKHDLDPLPPDSQLVIYELHVGDFSGGEKDAFARGRFVNVIEKLDYLKDLGINAIELMPIKQFPGNHSWGYNPRYFFAVECNYGSTEDAKRFIDECHARGIRVIYDGIYNHAEAECPLAKIDYEYWFHREPKDPVNNWGPEFNYEHYDEHLNVKPAWKFVWETVSYWIREFHIDGIRYDAAKQIGNFEFMRWIVQETKKLAGNKPFYNIAEYIPPIPAITGINGPMDGCWNDFFMYAMNDLLMGDTIDLEQAKDALDSKRKGFPGVTNVVNYLTNHDHDHFMTRLAAKNIFGDEAFRRAKLGAVLMMTAMGVPMIWMGEEFGEYKYKTIDESKLDWQLLANDQNKSLHALYSGLAKLRRMDQALFTANITFFYEDPANAVLAYVRWNNEGSRVVVIVNFSGHYLSGYTISNFPEDRTWREWTHSFDIMSVGGKLVIDLPEREAKVLV